MKGKWNLVGTIIKPVETSVITIGNTQSTKKVVYLQEDRANNQKAPYVYRIEFIGNYADFSMDSDARSKESIDLFGAHVCIIGHMTSWKGKNSVGDDVYMVTLRGERMIILNMPDMPIADLYEEAEASANE